MDAAPMSPGFVNPLPGVPTVENPFMEDILAAEGADSETLAIARQVAEQGYATVDLRDAGFDALADSIITTFTPGAMLDSWRDGGAGGLRVQDGFDRCPAVRDLAMHPRILGLLRRLYGRAAFPFQTLNFPTGSQQPAHTDSVHFSSLPERFMCGVWVALEDIHPDAGPLIFYPGSHRLPIYVNEHIGHCAASMPGLAHQGVFEAMWQGLIRRYGLRRVEYLPRRGEALIWAANLLHGGAPHRDRRRTRWSQVTHYFFEDCAYYTPMQSDPALGHVAFRQVADIGTGAPKPNRYVGYDIPEAFIRAVLPKPIALPPGFDPALYLEANPDVAAGGGEAVAHYLAFGWREGRRLRPAG